MTAESVRRNDRRPYIGEGVDGIRRSIDMDYEELDTLAADDPRRAAILDSVDRWREQLDSME